MILLALETATDACSVALLTDETINSRYVVAPRRHTELIMPMIDELLEAERCTRDQITAVAYGNGPGSFTGVRIAATLAQGIASARQLRVVGISTLQAMALGASRLHGLTHVLPALDARRQEIYLGEYRCQASTSLCAAGTADRLLSPEAVSVADTAPWVRCGNGWANYQDRLTSAVRALPVVEHDYPHAHDIARLGAAELNAGRGGSAATALPRYWREPVD